MTPHHNYNYNCNCNYATRISHYNSSTTTLQLQLQLHYTTLHPAVVGEVTIAIIATTPKNRTSTTFRSISGFALPSVIHNNNLSYRFPILKLPPPPCAVLLALCFSSSSLRKPSGHTWRIIPLRLGVSKWGYEWDRPRIADELPGL